MCKITKNFLDFINNEQFFLNNYQLPIEIINFNSYLCKPK